MSERVRDPETGRAERAPNEIVLGALPIDRFGTDEQRKTWLSGVASGETILTAAMAELVGEVILPGGSEPAKKAPKVALEAPTKSGPAAILPDDGDPRVRPEDFLPFFQFPGGRPGQSETTVAQPPTAPAPGQIPPSSATYHEE